jgi:hypothetical protein
MEPPLESSSLGHSSPVPGPAGASSWRLLALLTLLAAASGARGQELLVDGDFAGWSTTAQLAGHQVSGTRSASGGAPGAHYLVTHLHRSDAPFAPSVASISRSNDAVAAGLAAGERLEVEVDLAGEVPQPGAPVDLLWTLALEQGGRTFLALDTVFGPLPGAFRTDTLWIAADRFRALDGAAPQVPDLSPGAAPVRPGLVLQTFATASVGQPRTVQVRIDDFRLRRIDPRFAVSLRVSGGPVSDDAGALVPLVVEVENLGVGRDDLVVTEVVPVGTVFVAEASSPGWQCAPGPDEGGVCRLALGGLTAGGARELLFTVRRLAGFPVGFELLHDAGLARALPHGKSHQIAGCGECRYRTAVEDSSCCFLFLLAGFCGDRFRGCQSICHTN